MNRSPARAGSALAALGCLALLAAAFAPVRVLAGTAPDLWFGGTRLILEHPQMHDDEIAVATSDPGLGRFLAKAGATIAYAPRQRYAVVTAADRRTITFTIGDPRVLAGGTTTTAPFAPYTDGADVYISLIALVRALYVVPVADGSTTVLQPQIGALDVRGDGGTTIVTLHGATPLVYRQTSGSVDQLVLTFSGVASSLDHHREVGAPGLNGIDVQSLGSPRAPLTTITFSLPSGAGRAILGSHSPNDMTFQFAPQGVALRGPAIPAQADAATLQSGHASTGGRVVPPPPIPANGVPPASAPATDDQSAQSSATTTPPATQVTAVDLIPGDDAATVHVTMSGGADYEWHRLNDGRWYIDLRGATLAMAPRDDQPNTGGITGLRVRQFAQSPMPIVRVSLSLDSPHRVDVAAADGGVNLVVGSTDDSGALRIGAGRIGSGAVTAYTAPSPPLRPGPAPPHAANPRLIVLDPGHGGSDAGAAHNGLTEKGVTLDIARRLQTVLMSRGWTVRMTRSTDTDVYAPNDSAHDELQARCDVANAAGARMFISVHVNSFTSSGLNGTTTYYYKGIDQPLAQAIQRRLIASLGTRDDGVRKENFYVIHHTTMPAVLVETAFLSNPGDAELLHSPEFLQKVALAIADGVNDYASQNQAAANSSDSDQ